MNNETGNATRGTEALDTIRNRKVGTTPDGLFEQVISASALSETENESAQRFWLGTGFGVALAASVFALAVTFGWFGDLAINQPDSAQFHIALHEPRQMDVAIETDQPLAGATISILLVGSVEISGFPGQRELTWADDLDAGVNRLSLPLVATGQDGGQVVVHMSHPKSKQVFVVNLKTDV